MPRAIDITGQRFGRLVALAREGSQKNEGWTWRCVCDCGSEVVSTSRNLRSGNTRSCGCLRRETTSARSRKHGASNGGGVRSAAKEYQTWQAMKDRCGNPDSESFATYGGRGIAVCERWRESFESFLADMGPKPSPSHSIDRIDNDGGYCPENCRWATPKEQARNTRKSLVIVAFGESMIAADWAERTGIPAATIKSRLRLGLHPEAALSSRWFRRGTKPRAAA